MTMTERSAPRFRLNSIFLKLAAMMFVSAVVFAVVTSVLYTRANLTQIEHTMARSAADTNALLSNMLSGSIIANAPGPVEREFARLTGRENSEALSGLAINGAGALIAAKGEGPEIEAALMELARVALQTGEPQVSDDGMMVADPIVNTFSQKTSGALATAWTSEFAASAALMAQARIIGLASILMLVGVVFVVWAIRRWITRPMIATARSVDRLAAQDLTVTFATGARGDELGDIGKSLETLRQRLITGREEARENRFRGTAFRSSTAAIMMVDSAFEISTVNSAVAEILQHYQEDFRQVSASFDPEKIIGQSMDVFHPGELSQRVRNLLMDPANLPFTAEIAVGSARFQLTINRVEDESGALEGFVVEWNDITASFMNTAVLDAIESNQAKVEFGLDGTLLHSNDLFARVLDTEPAELVGRASGDIFDFDEEMALERGHVFERLGSGESVYGSFRVKRGDGTLGTIDGGFTPVLDNAGRLLRIILIGSDMTQAKRSLEQAERERTDRLATQAMVVDTLRRGLERLADGDLTNRIDDSMPDEYDQLRDDFNLAADRLQEAMRGVIENADLIQGEALEISSAADDLSARTERQAATLEETASALDQLTSSVQSAAEGATHANDLVVTARENAEASGEVVRQAVEAMGEIETSSQQISKITGVIDDIAFQTNLLALNAGVEAARAGEAGRGFAVVASEVRALAQRSSDAAREINALISASGGHVQRGVDLVDQAGEALKGIVESVSEISRNVNEIAVGSREQSVGLVEINTAVNQLDQVTQQNAAMFEETTAASHALTREAETLTRTMGRFQIGRAKKVSENVVDVAFVSQRGSDPDPADAVKEKVAASGQAAQGGETASRLLDDGWDEF